MATIDLVDLLEIEWENIQAKLATDQWKQFTDAVAGTVEEESTADSGSLDQAIQTICNAMQQFEYTRYLLEYFQARQASVRGIGPPSKIGDRVEVRAIRNRLRNLSSCHRAATSLRDESSTKRAGDAERDPNRPS